LDVASREVLGDSGKVSILTGCTMGCNVTVVELDSESRSDAFPLARDIDKNNDEFVRGCREGELAATFGGGCRICEDQLVIRGFS